MVDEIDATILLTDHAHQELDGILLRHGSALKATGAALFPNAPAALEAALAVLDAYRRCAARAEGGSSPGAPPRLAIHACRVEAGAAHRSVGFSRAQALFAAASPGQLLLSAAAAEQVRASLPAGAGLRDWGRRRLIDLTKPEHIYELIQNERDGGAPRTLEAYATNLPPQPTALIGREAFIREAIASFEQPDVRLLTLTGPGGTGKTRLGLQIAAQLLPAFPDGVWFVDLAPVGDPALVLPTIAQILQFTDTSQENLIERLGHALAGQRMLLVADNFEHVLDAAAGLAALLNRAPELHILATSRERLRITLEHEMAVAPLALGPPGDDDDAALLADSEAVRLFVARARAVQADFALSAENAPSVAAICRRLDGLPLAIELAAARSKLFPPPALLARLNNRLPLLTGGGRDLPLRQQTLRNAIAWSYELLTPAEQALFRRLAVFVGSWDIDALMAVCGDDARERDARPPAVHPDDHQAAKRAPFLDSAWCLEGLESLHDKSLVQSAAQSIPAAQPAPGRDDSRFRTLQTIRDFALEQAETADEMAITQHRHASFYAALAEASEPGLRGAGQRAWLSRLEDEHDNMRAALRWSLAHEPVLAGRLAGGLWRFWMIRGYLTEGKDWITAALAYRDSLPIEQIALLLLGDGLLAHRQGHSLYAVEVMRQSLHAWERTTNDVGLALSLNGLGIAEAKRGNVAEAQTCYAESLALWESLNDQYGIAMVLHNLGLVFQRRSAYAQAKAAYVEALAIHRTQGLNWMLAMSLNNLGNIFLDQGDFAAAQSHYDESFALRSAISDRVGMAECLLNFADLARVRGDLDQAEYFLTQTELIARETEDVGNLIGWYTSRGEIAFERGRLRESREFLIEAVRLSRQEGDVYQEAYSLVKLAALAVNDHHAEAAESISQSQTLFQQFDSRFGMTMVLDAYASLVAAIHGNAADQSISAISAADLLLEQIGAVRPRRDQDRHDQLLLILRAATPADRFVAAWERGRAMTPRAILDQAPIVAPAVAPPPPIAIADLAGQPRTRMPAASPPAPDPLPAAGDLTRRELEILRLLATGLTNTEIAERLILSHLTVKTHVRSIYSKLGVKNRTAAARYALENHLI